VPNAPAASCALLVVSMRTSIRSGGTGNIRHSPRNGFNGLWRALPGDEFVLPPSPANGWSHAPGRAAADLRRLDTSNGCQDHTLLPYASAPFVFVHVHRSRSSRPAVTSARRRCRVHRIPRSTFVTIAIRPSLVEAGWREGITYFGKTELIYFFPEHLDSRISVESLEEISVYAHATFELKGQPSEVASRKIRLILPDGRIGCRAVLPIDFAWRSMGGA
jgi:hypothetical protein